MSFTSENLVLVTGANGHVGSHLVHLLLSAPDGPRVRAVVRFQSSSAGLRSVFSSHVQTGRLEFCCVPDMTKSAAYDEAVRGVTHIAHIASPLVLNPVDIEKDLLEPAIRGTTSLLASALHAQSLESVVVTSSFAAAFDPFRGWASDYVYTSADWNPLSYAQGAGRKPIDGIDPRYQAFTAYLSSKKLAEEAAWKFVDSHAVSWRFSTILPTYIGGPSLLPPHGAEGIDGYSFSQKKIVEVAKRRSNKDMVDDFPFWVDVRDVARAHAAALAMPNAAGRRWIIAAENARMWHIAKAIRVQFPLLNIQVEKEVDRCFSVDCRDTIKELGLEELIPLEQMVADTLSPTLPHMEEHCASNA